MLELQSRCILHDRDWRAPVAIISSAYRTERGLFWACCINFHGHWASWHKHVIAKVWQLVRGIRESSQWGEWSDKIARDAGGVINDHHLRVFGRDVQRTFVLRLSHLKVENFLYSSSAADGQNKSLFEDAVIFIYIITSVLLAIPKM